ncbi:related to ELF1 |uniref:Transcription elongation factor 1 homolog n=1 Tax=Lecanosticta acicola TaxID=111012 RepID=A0AAI8YST7_9PEZI|nr:related to ELF1 \
MGKRKKSSRKPTGPRKREPLATNFKCVFCNHETAVTVKIDKKGGVGNLNCKSCGQTFQTGVNYLSQAVDVYADWIDACDAVAKDSGGTVDGVPPAIRRPNQPQASARAGLAPGEKYTDEDDGFIDDDGVDAEADYADDD